MEKHNKNLIEGIVLQVCNFDHRLYLLNEDQVTSVMVTFFLYGASPLLSPLQSPFFLFNISLLTQRNTTNIYSNDDVVTTCDFPYTTSD